MVAHYHDINEFLQGRRRAVILATDHRYLGMHGLDRPEQVLPQLLPYADALMTDLGVLRALRRHTEVHPEVKPWMDGIPIILRASGSTGLALAEALSDEFIALWPDDLTRYRAQAAAVSVNLRPPSDTEFRKFGYQALGARRRTLENLAALCRAAAVRQMPVLGVVAVGEDLESMDMSSETEVEWFLRTIRSMTAVGADAIKSYYCGEEGTRTVVEAATVPVVIAGGKPPRDVDPTYDSIAFALRVRAAGAAGLDVGRRIWRHKEQARPELDPSGRAPVAMLRTYREIFHGNLSDAEAVDRYYELLEEEQSGAQGRHAR